MNPILIPEINIMTFGREVEVVEHTFNELKLLYGNTLIDIYGESSSNSLYISINKSELKLNYNNRQHIVSTFTNHTKTLIRLIEKVDMIDIIRIQDSKLYLSKPNSDYYINLNTMELWTLARNIPKLIYRHHNSLEFVNYLEKFFTNSMLTLEQEVERTIKCEATMALIATGDLVLDVEIRGFKLFIIPTGNKFGIYIYKRDDTPTSYGRFNSNSNLPDQLYVRRHTRLLNLNELKTELRNIDLQLNMYYDIRTDIIGYDKWMRWVENENNYLKFKLTDDMTRQEIDIYQGELTRKANDRNYERVVNKGRKTLNSSVDRFFVIMIAGIVTSTFYSLRDWIKMLILPNVAWSTILLVLSGLLLIDIGCYLKWKKSVGVVIVRMVAKADKKLDNVLDEFDD